MLADPLLTACVCLSLQLPLCLPPRPDRDALLKAIHDVVEKAGVVKEGWNGYNVIHDNASRVAALDIGFAPRWEC